MTSCVRILSTDTLDSSPSLLLLSPSQGPKKRSKILVQCGEGTQRLFLEYGQKISTVTQICVTHLSHATIGGLPGMILSSADVVQTATAQAQHKIGNYTPKNANQTAQQPKTKKTPPNAATATAAAAAAAVCAPPPQLTIVGPRGTQRFLRSLRHFMRRDAFHVTVQEGAYNQQQDPLKTGGTGTSGGGGEGEGKGRPTKQQQKQNKKKKKQNKCNDDDDEDGAFRIQSIVTYDTGTIATSPTIPTEVDSEKVSTTRNSYSSHNDDIHENGRRQQQQQHDDDNSSFSTSSKKRPRTTFETKEESSVTTSVEPNNNNNNSNSNSNSNSNNNNDATGNYRRTIKPTTNNYPQQNQQQQEYHHDDKGEQILSFLFTTASIPGKFLIEKALELGIPKGPLYGQLKAGKSVTFTKATTKRGGERGDDEAQPTRITVESQQVVEPPSPGTAVAVLCYPTWTIFQQLQQASELQPYYDQPQPQPQQPSTQSSKQPLNPVLELVIHMTSEELFTSAACTNWRTTSFGNNVQHLLLRTNTAPMTTVTTSIPTNTSTAEYKAAAALSPLCTNGSRNRTPSTPIEVIPPSPFHTGQAGATMRSQLCPAVYIAPTVASSSSLSSSLLSSGHSKSENYCQDTVHDVPNQDAGNGCVVRHAVPLLEYVFLPRSKRGFQNGNAYQQHGKDIDDKARTIVQTSGCIDQAHTLLADVPRSITDNTATDNEQQDDEDDNDGGEILFTGTGSAIPCKHRNVSGIYVRMASTKQKKKNYGNAAMLLDVGEGTVGQLLRAKQYQQQLINQDQDQDPNHPTTTNESLASVVLRNIKAVWISHPHADHHLGLIRLLEERNQVITTAAAAAASAASDTATTSCPDTKINENESSSDDPLILIGPPSILYFLKEYESINPRILGSYNFLDCRDIMVTACNNSNMDTNGGHTFLQNYNSANNNTGLLLARLEKDLGITTIRSVRVAHCRDSFAVIVRGGKADIDTTTATDATDGMSSNTNTNTVPFDSIAYSGDCRPSKIFASIAKDMNVQLLIHEATFENGMEHDATLKRHSTVGEAVRIGHEMNAKITLLTHFSQRYPKLPQLHSNSNSSSSSRRRIQPGAAITTIVDGNKSNDGSTSNNRNTTDTTMTVIPVFDFMTITPNNIASAAVLTPALQLLYPDGDDKSDGISSSNADTITATTMNERTNNSTDGDDNINTITASMALQIPGLFAQSELL